MLGLKVGDLSVDENRVYYAYRGKGGKQGRRELPRLAHEAIVWALAAFGKEIPSTVSPSHGDATRSARTRGWAR